MNHPENTVRETAKMTNYKFKQNDPVRFFVSSSLQGTGIVKGYSTMSMPVIGSTVIVEVTDGFLPNEVYPFNTFAIWECHLGHI